MITMTETIIDATNSIVGRLGTVIAKRALLGETIRIVNAEKAIVSGNKNYLVEEFHHRIKKGVPSKGPFFPRREDMMLRRMLRGMLPRKQERGIAAFKRIKCYIGVPPEFQGKPLEKIKEADGSRLVLAKHLTLQQISSRLR